MKSETKRFSVIALHTHTECNLHCSFCYRTQTKREDQYDFKFFEDLIPHLNKYTEQVSIGGGEPFYFPKELIKLTKICEDNGLIANVTTNGTLLKDKTDSELKQLLKHITLLSISMDKEKIKSQADIIGYFDLVKRIKKLDLCQVGTNLLVDKDIDYKKLYIIVTGLLKEVDRVYTLYPKNIIGPDITDKNMKLTYQLLTLSNEHFYVDDLGNSILRENKYSDWKNPCHFGKIISIDEVGNVKGCSFDTEPILVLKKPKDILKIDNITFKKRHDCPYVIDPTKQGDNKL